MGMDVDYICARESLGRVEKILSDIEHDGREEICDDILAFEMQMEAKYGNNKGDE